MKRILNVLLMSAAAYFYFSGCALVSVIQNAEKPSVTLSSAEIVSITLTEINIRLHTIVTNPYPVPFPASTLAMDVSVEGSHLSRMDSKLQSIPASQQKPVPVDVKITYHDLAEIYKKMPGKETLVVSIKGNLAVNFPKQTIIPGLPDHLDLPFEAQKEIPAVLPSIAIRNFRIIRPEIPTTAPELIKRAEQYIDGLFNRNRPSPGSAAASGLSQIDVTIRTEFEIVLKNDAAARINFEKLNYVLTVNKENFLSGTDTAILNQGRESVVTVQTSFPLKGITSTLADIIRRKSAAFQLVGSAQIMIPGLSGEGLSYQFDRSGNLTWQ